MDIRTYSQIIFGRQKKQMKTVITYGTFDLLHYGHLNLLKRASRLGDRLIVGVSTDEFCLEKGKKTVFKLEQRMEMVSDLKYVYLTIPEHDMAQKVSDIEKYGADIFVLGSDYSDTFLKMPEYELIKDKCDIIFLPRTDGISTTILKNERSLSGKKI